MKISVGLVFHGALVGNVIPYPRPQSVFVFAWSDGLNDVSALERKGGVISEWLRISLSTFLSAEGLTLAGGFKTVGDLNPNIS